MKRFGELLWLTLDKRRFCNRLNTFFRWFIFFHNFCLVAGGTLWSESVVGEWIFIWFSGTVKTPCCLCWMKFMVLMEYCQTSSCKSKKLSRRPSNSATTVLKCQCPRYRWAKRELIFVPTGYFFCTVSNNRPSTKKHVVVGCETLLQKITSLLVSEQIYYVESYCYRSNLCNVCVWSHFTSIAADRRLCR